MDLSSRDHYSAEVDLTLHVQGELIDLMQTGPDYIILREARKLPACDAELLITIGGRRKVYPIVLQGADGLSKEVRYW